MFRLENLACIRLIKHWYIKQGLTLVISVPADVLQLNSARPSAGTVLQNCSGYDDFFYFFSVTWS